MTRRFESWAISSTLKEYSLIDVPDGILVTLDFAGWKRGRRGNYPTYKVHMFNEQTGQRIISKKAWALATAKRKAQALAWNMGWLADVGCLAPDG